MRILSRKINRTDLYTALIYTALGDTLKCWFWENECTCNISYKEEIWKFHFIILGIVIKAQENWWEIPEVLKDHPEVVVVTDHNQVQAQQKKPQRKRQKRILKLNAIRIIISISNLTCKRFLNDHHMLLWIPLPWVNFFGQDHGHDFKPMIHSTKI